MKYIAPSLLNLKKDQRLNIANELLENGIKWIHYDVMDGKFVPNHAIEIEEIIHIKTNAKKHIADAHLMVENPLYYFEKLWDKVEYLTFHFEALKDENEIWKIIQKYKSKVKIGISLKPETKIEKLDPFLKDIDLVLIMSVEPGKGGQKFIDSSLEKIAYIKEKINKQNLNLVIQVDGGINNITAKQAFKSGADVLVAGTYLVFEPTKEKIASLLD
ncbi:ribulose-phosphate 3-epimerase [Mycoplasmopsis pulmonis]|uniref:ribulose-phosphate 3-epimerase n=1 Tax=Mycoplasmopsis pulmonis TaxID=2107 RepID=UPI0010050CCF|nr:ribulose-phosphate 3-epimerase [Mycoplasmopsis pulmonis]MDZ7293464.1 ribulose-phosphate 3-epimerase [Mycoplasmopsis pulmonis]VEU68450.1 d-ribulose-5-phosphate 3 epimerase [Mycoplasmopsis pulmonis]